MTRTNTNRRGPLARAGLAAELTIALAELVMVVALYRLFQHVSEGLSLLAAAARSSMLVLQGLNVAVGAWALSVAATQPELVEPLFDARGAIESVWQAFFAVHCGVLGVLVARSGVVRTSAAISMS